ncbi:hypothetical protein NFJ02_12g10300 [Pycnococcus provasolii]
MAPSRFARAHEEGSLPPRARSTEPTRLASQSRNRVYDATAETRASKSLTAKSPFAPSRFFSHCLQPSVRRTSSSSSSSSSSPAQKTAKLKKREEFSAHVSMYESAQHVTNVHPISHKILGSSRRKGTPPLVPPSRSVVSHAAASRNAALRRSEPTKLPSLPRAMAASNLNSRPLPALKPPERAPPRRSVSPAPVKIKRTEDVERLCHALLRAAVTEQRRYYDSKRRLMKRAASSSSAKENNGPVAAA